jgi:hypothetical protein
MAAPSKKVADDPARVIGDWLGRAVAVGVIAVILYAIISKYI